MGASSEDEASARVSRETLTLPSAMNHQQVVFHKRVASLYFTLKSSSKYLFFAMIPLVLRSVGFEPLQVGALRAVSALSSIMFVEFAMIRIRSPKKRKILAHLCLVLASANVLAYLAIPPAFEHTSSTLMPQHCHAGANFSEIVNGTRFDAVDKPQSPLSTVQAQNLPIIPTSESGPRGKPSDAGERSAPRTSPSFPETFPPSVSSALPPESFNVPLTPSVKPIDESRNIKDSQVGTSGFPERGRDEPDWVKGIIDAQNSGAEALRRQKRDAGAPNVVPSVDQLSEIQQQQQVAELIPYTVVPSEEAATLATETQAAAGSSGKGLIESLWETVTDALSVANSPHSFIVACLLLLSLEVYFALMDRISIRLYTDYLDQIERNFDHFPLAHFVALFSVLTAIATYFRFQCEIAPNFELPTALLGVCGFILGLATLVFTCFPVPERRKVPDRDSLNPVKLTVYGNFRAMMIFSTLVMLGMAVGVEQNFLLWHLVDNGAGIPYIAAFIGIPLLVSGLLIARIPKRVRKVHRFLLAALLSVSIRFVSYSFYSKGNVKWAVLCLQVVTPASSTLLWKAVDSFLQQITFPNDHAPISRSMRFAVWGLGFSSGSLMAGYAWQLGDTPFFLLVFGCSAAVAAVILFAVNLCVRIQDMKESHYMRILETDHVSKRPINRFEETDESDDEDNDQVVEFQVKPSKPS